LAKEMEMRKGWFCAGTGIRGREATISGFTQAKTDGQSLKVNWHKIQYRYKVSTFRFKHSLAQLFPGGLSNDPGGTLGLNFAPLKRRVSAFRRRTTSSRNMIDTTRTNATPPSTPPTIAPTLRLWLVGTSTLQQEHEMNFRRTQAVRKRDDPRVDDIVDLDDARIGHRRYDQRMRPVGEGGPRRVTKDLGGNSVIVDDVRRAVELYSAGPEEDEVDVERRAWVR
jgi:hypothetical protein